MINKVVILAGGMGLRLFEETIAKPKTMIEIEGKPLLWHIMSRFAFFGYNEFVICLGYRPDVVISYFLEHDHVLLEKNSESQTIELFNKWKITFVNTGTETMTAGRIKRVEKYIEDDFFVSYSDNLSDIDLNKFYEFHKSNEAICSMVVVNPKLNYGLVQTDGNHVTGFVEKPLLNDKLINAGYFLCKKEITSLIDSDASVLEIETMQKLVEADQLRAFKHNGFWKSIDTYKDLTEIRDMNVSDKIINE